MASDSAPIRYRSKKPFTSASKTADEIRLSSKSTQEPAELLPRRTRNRGVALSIKEVRKVTESLRQSNRHSPIAEIGSSQKEILESESSVQKPKKMSSGSPELPEKYETLIQFFNALVNSIRLSKLKLTTPLFTNLCTKIKVLTERNFTYHHLAQLKFVLPEAIELKKMMVTDDETYCTKPNLHISLNADAIETTKDKNMNLQKIFRSRLLEFIKTHPEGDDVPEESLPEPFDQLQLHSRLPVQTPIENDGILKPTSLHLSQSFKPRFSRNMVRTLMEKNRHVQSEVSVESPSFQENSNALATPIKVNFSIQSASISIETPIKEIDNLDSTPAKLVSTPVQTMAQICASQPTKRSLDIPKDDSENSLNKLVRRPPRSRTLQFSEEDSGMRQKDGTCYNDDVLDVLSDSLLQSIREKEQKLIEEKDPAISLAKRRRRIMENLPKRFDTIRHLFRSLNRSVMTKQELVYKIVTNCSDIDRVEAEEELGVLTELAPEWIMEKSASTGDVIICIKKSSNADEIRKRLAEAK